MIDIKLHMFTMLVILHHKKYCHTLPPITQTATAPTKRFLQKIGGAVG